MVNGIEVRFVAVELEQDVQKVILSFFKTTSRILVVYFVENSLYVILTNLSMGRSSVAEVGA